MNTFRLLTVLQHRLVFFFFFFNDTATTEIYTLSLHDALPIYNPFKARFHEAVIREEVVQAKGLGLEFSSRSEEHTSELQSQSNLVCRLLLEKKKVREQHSKLCASTQSQSVSPPVHPLTFSRHT